VRYYKTLIWSNILMALDAAGWTGLTFKALNMGVDFILMLLSFTFTWLFYTRDRLDISEADRLNNPERSAWYASKKHLKTLVFLAIFIILGCLSLRLFLILPVLIGIVPCLFYTKKWTYQKKIFSLKGLPGMKVLLVAFLWVLLTVGFPISSTASRLPSMTNILAYGWMVGFFIMLQIHTNDLRDIEGDKKDNIHSFAVLLGDYKARLLGLVFLGVGVYCGWALFSHIALLFFGFLLTLRTVFYKKEKDLYWQILISLQGVLAYFVL
jgi:4-hydroxybenzoate polyprenyltransferase